MTVPEPKLLIGGDFRDAAVGERFPVLDPSTGEPFAELARGRAADIDAAVAAACAARDGAWGRMAASERGRILSRMAAAIAWRGCVAHRAGAGQDRAGGGASRGRAQHRHRLWRGGGRTAGGAPGRGTCVLHRQRRGRPARAGGGGRQLRMARRLRAGQVFINNYGAGGGVELPFGGVGKSGHGREKGFEALYGFAALKTVATKYE